MTRQPTFAVRRFGPVVGLGRTDHLLGNDSKENQALWLTTPGLSDGPCGLAPTSKVGEFVPDLAVGLIS